MMASGRVQGKGMRTSPKDSPCLYCGKLLTKRGVYEHERHSCRKNPNRVKRTFGKKRCPECGKAYHAAGLRAHMATQHPQAFINDKARRKPSSRAAQRRKMVASPDSSRALGRKEHERRGPQTKLSSERPAPRQATAAQGQEPGKAKKPTHRPPEGRTEGSPKRAWSAMRQKMSEALP